MTNPPIAKHLNILIVGGGIAGQTAAYWLARGGHHVTVVERFPALRATGAQVDLRGQGIEAIKKMGLLETVRGKLVDELGVAFVNEKGKARATIMANTTGKGRQSLTSEYEIMRGDLVRILHDATKNDVEYIFGRSVDAFEQDDDSVMARFSDGTSSQYDLLIGADGQGSRIRASVEPPNSPEPYWNTGIHMAYWFIPRIDQDSNIRDTYMVPGGRQIMRRSHNSDETQVYFVLRESSKEASAIHREPIQTQKRFWAKKFLNAGWQSERFINGMANASFFYSQEVQQIRTATWSKGRAVLIGDAAHCASPYSGMGISGALVGAYVLAGEINRNPQDLTKAFANYDAALRPFVDEIQSAVKPSLLRLGLPRTALAISAFQSITALATALHIPELTARLAKTDRDGSWKLPTYSQMNDGSDSSKHDDRI